MPRGYLSICHSDRLPDACSTPLILRLAGTVITQTWKHRVISALLELGCERNRRWGPISTLSLMQQISARLFQVHEIATAQTENDLTWRGKWLSYNDNELTVRNLVSWAVSVYLDRSITKCCLKEVVRNVSIQIQPYIYLDLSANLPVRVTLRIKWTLWILLCNGK